MFPNGLTSQIGLYQDPAAQASARMTAQRQSQDYRMPTYDNPMMNVPITAYDQSPLYKNYYHYDGASGPRALQVQVGVDDRLVAGLFQNPADRLFQRNNSQRQWYSVPVGSVPNDQTEFAQWLYGIANNCKAGSIWDRYGLQYTDDSLMCTGADAGAQLTNFGRMGDGSTI